MNCTETNYTNINKELTKWVTENREESAVRYSATFEILEFVQGNQPSMDLGRFTISSFPDIFKYLNRGEIILELGLTQKITLESLPSSDRVSNLTVYVPNDAYKTSLREKFPSLEYLNYQQV